MKRLVRESIITDISHPIVKKAIKNYSRNREQMEANIIEPGEYAVYEPDYGRGMSVINQFVIKIIEPMSEWELALQVAEHMKYISNYPWFGTKPNYRKEKPVKTFPQKQIKIEF